MILLIIFVILSLKKRMEEKKEPESEIQVANNAGNEKAKSNG